jgi:hypothetical protein
MKSLFQAILLFGFVMPAFCAIPEVDFDSKSKDASSNLVGGLNTFNNPSISYPKIEIVPAKGKAVGTTSKIALEITEDGEKIVEPIAVEDGKSSYEFMPNSVNAWKFTCGDQNSAPGTWSMCWSFQFQPAMAGHNHTPTGTLAYINPSSPPQLLPTAICKSDIPVNTPYSINFRTPYYSSLVTEKTEFYGACSSVMNDDVSIRVTTKNLIQLAELTAEPYFEFKVSEDQKAHPGNHFATPDTNSKMKQIAWEYYQQFNEKLTINDMGLVWGGRYNTFSPYNCWVDGAEHVYHRYGRQVDIRSIDMPTEERNCLIEIACKYQVQPILEGKYPGSLLGHDYSSASSKELDALDRIEHYHFNFVRPTDMVVDPKDDSRITCPAPVIAEKSACPKQLGRVALP